MIIGKKIKYIVSPSSRFINQISAEEKDKEEDYYYLASLPINRIFPTLIDEVIVPEHAKEQMKYGNLWIGNGGQITPLHHDTSTGDPGMDGKRNFY